MLSFEISVLLLMFSTTVFRRLWLFSWASFSNPFTWIHDLPEKVSRSSAFFLRKLLTASETGNWLSKISTCPSNWFTLFISLSIYCCCSGSFASRWSLCLLSEAVSVIISVVVIRVNGGVAGVLVIFRAFLDLSVGVLIRDWVAAFFLCYLFGGIFSCVFDELFLLGLRLLDSVWQ